MQANITGVPAGNYTAWVTIKGSTTFETVQLGGVDDDTIFLNNLPAGQGITFGFYGSGSTVDGMLSDRTNAKSSQYVHARSLLPVLFSKPRCKKSDNSSKENPTDVPSEMGPVTRYYYNRGEVTMRPCTQVEGSRIQVAPTPRPSPSPRADTA